jgi:hypothetical protein
MFGAAVPPKPGIRPQGYAPPPPALAPQGYQPPLPPGLPPPREAESKTGLYIGLGIGAVVLIGGGYLLFRD